MKLKLDEKGNVVVKDGHPVYLIEENGETKELVFDAPQAMSKITQLQAENKEKRIAAEEAATKLKAFGDMDPAAAIKAIETVKNLDVKDLDDNKKTEALKAQLKEIAETEKKNLTTQFQTRERELQDSISGQKDTIRHLLITNEFSKSSFFGGEKPKTNLPPEVAAAYFANNFKVEGEGSNVKIVGYLKDEKIVSSERFGEDASFDESIKKIIDASPNKDRILSSTPGGPGSKNSFNSDDSAFIPISRADSGDVVKYRAVREIAEKAGKPIKIVD